MSVCIKSGPLQNGTSGLCCNTCRFPFRNLRQRWGRFDSLSLMLMPAGKSKPVTWKCTNGCFHSLSLLNFNVLHEGKLHQTFNLEWFQTFVLISGNRVQVPNFLSCFVCFVYSIFCSFRRHQVPLLRGEELVWASLRLEHRRLHQLPEILHEVWWVRLWMWPAFVVAKIKCWSYCFSWWEPNVVNSYICFKDDIQQYHKYWQSLESELNAECAFNFVGVVIWGPL